MSDEDRHGRQAPDRCAQALLDAVVRADDAPERRIAMAIAELSGRSHHPLSDLERALLARLSEMLVHRIEIALRSTLLAAPDASLDRGFIESMGSERVSIAYPQLERAAMLHDSALVALLLRRIDEYCLGSALRRQGDGRAGSPFDALIEDDNAAISDAAMAVLIAEVRHNDRLDEPALLPADMPADLLHDLVWKIAAAIRSYAVNWHGIDPAQLDPPIAAAASAFLGMHDEGERLEAAAIALAQALDEDARLTDAVLVDLHAMGRLAAYAAALATRARVAFDPVWGAVVGRDQSRHIVVLRATGVADAIAAQILQGMQAAHGDRDADGVTLDLMTGFRTLSVDRAKAAIAPWRHGETYREAIGRLAFGATGIQS